MKTYEKCCENCKFYMENFHPEGPWCNWWDEKIESPSTALCDEFVLWRDDSGKTGMLCNRCGHEVEVEPDSEIDCPYYCPECDENMHEFECHRKDGV